MPAAFRLGVPAAAAGWIPFRLLIDLLIFATDLRRSRCNDENLIVQERLYLPWPDRATHFGLSSVPQPVPLTAASATQIKLRWVFA